MSTTTIPGGAVGSQIGRSLPRIEGRDKVSGRAEYTHNLRLPGMLHAKIFRSTIAHGRIKSIDTSAAKKVPGVYRVVTIDDIKTVIPNPYYGPAFHDQPILAHEKVRFVGEPVAVVLASDPHVAEQAVQEITAEYEELPAVYDEMDALTSKVYVHDELKPAGSFADPGPTKTLSGMPSTWGGRTASAWPNRSSKPPRRPCGGRPRARGSVAPMTLLRRMSLTYGSSRCGRFVGT